MLRLSEIAVHLDEEVGDKVLSLNNDYSEHCLFGDDEGLDLECAI